MATHGEIRWPRWGPSVAAYGEISMAAVRQLRSGDPTFAEASARYPDHMSEWQAAVYLLTGSDVVWAALGHHGHG